MTFDSLEVVLTCVVAALAAAPPGGRNELVLEGFGGGGMLRVSSLSRALELTSLSDVSSRIMDSFSSLDVFREVENVGNRLRRFACFEVEPPPLEEVSGLPPPSSCCNDLRCSVGASNMEIGRALPEPAGLRTEGSRLGEAILNGCMRRSELRVRVVSSCVESNVKCEGRDDC